MCERLAKLLQQVVRDPEIKIMDVEFLDDTSAATDVAEMDVELVF
jgi:hypothetical protein